MVSLNEVSFTHTLVRDKTLQSKLSRAPKHKVTALSGHLHLRSNSHFKQYLVQTPDANAQHVK